MKLHFLFLYIIGLFLIISCGSTSGTIADDNSLASEVNTPDEDYDGVPNDVDKCPYIYGTARTFGCPDADGDGIRDSEDKCPDMKGKTGSGPDGSQRCRWRVCRLRACL